MKVTSTQTAFIGGRRFRPGEVFDLADDAALAPGMTKVQDDKPAKKSSADTKPAEAAAAAAAKQGAGQGAGGDTKPAEAQAAAAKKAGAGQG